MDQKAPGQAGPQANETAFDAHAFYETLDGERRSRGRRLRRLPDRWAVVHRWHLPGIKAYRGA